MELVSICRLFAQAQDQTSRSYVDLRSVLEVVDEALASAAEKTPKNADEKFKKATDALSAYEKRCHSRCGSKETVAEKMVKAGTMDKTSSTTLNRLKAKFLPLKEEKMETIEFLLHKSLPDRSPTVVKQVLGESSSLKEILWNIARFKDQKRLTLKQNPHFYKVLPTSPEDYEGKFRSDPIETFRDKKISVLTDNSGLTGRVFLETANETRAFGNVWVPKDAIIFKDVSGKLEGESIVGAAIQGTPDLWCFEEPPLSPSSRSPNRSSPSPTSNTTPTTPTLLNGDWREPIRRMLRSLSNVNIRISAKPRPTNSSPSPTLPSSPIPPSDSSNIVGSLPPAFPSRPPIITLQIPGASTGPLKGPLSASSYRTARSTPLSERPPVAEPSPRSPAPPFPEPHFALPTHPTSAPVPCIAAQLRAATVAVPLSGPAEPVSTTHPLPAISSREVCREVHASSGDSTQSQALITEAPSSGPDVTIISPWKAVDPIGPRVERNEARVAEHVPSQLPDPSIVPTTVPIHLTAIPAAMVSTTIPTAVPTGVPKQKKRHWYQKCFDVIKNNLLPGSS